MKNIIATLFTAIIMLLAMSPALAGDQFSAVPVEGAQPEEHHVAAVANEDDHIKSLVQSGRASLVHGEYDAALKSLMEAYALDPQNHETIHSIMAVHVRRGNYTEAVSFLEQAANRLNEESGRKEINEIIALIYFKKALNADKNGKGDEAEVSLRKAVSLAPESVQYLIALARIRHKAGNFDEADKLLGQRLKQVTDEASRREITSAREKLRQNEAILRKIR